MKKSIILLLISFLISISVEAQQPIPITSLARSSNPLMTIQTNANRYQSYQYFTTAWGDTLLNFMQANPNWLGTYLPAGAVNIAAAGNNLQFTQGGTFRWTSDTTSLGEWIPQFTVSPLLSGGLINQRLIGVGSLANKYIGISGQDNIGLYVDGYPDIYLRNSQVQDTSLAAGNYYPHIDELGKVTFGQSGIFAVPDSQTLDMSNKVFRDSSNGVFAIGNFPNFPNINYNAPGSQTSGFYISPDYWGNSFGAYAPNPSGVDLLELYPNLLYSRLSNLSRNSQFLNLSFSSSSVGIDMIETDKVIGVRMQPNVNLKLSNTLYHNPDSLNSSHGYGINIGNSTGYKGIGLNPSGQIRVSISSTTSQGVNGFDYIRIDPELVASPTTNAVSFYNNSYQFANQTPVSTNNVKSLHTLTGNGTNTTPAIETMPSLFSAISAQNTGDQILTTGVNNTFIFDNISFTSGSNITITADTLINFLSLGVYEISLDGRFESSSAAEPTAVQFVQQGVGIADLGANFLFSISTDDQITPFKRIFEVTALPAAVYIINEATTWSSGSVLFSATSSLNVKRLY